MAFTNNEIGTGANDTKVFVSSLGVMTGGTTAAGNMRKNNGAKAVGSDLNYSSVNYDYEENEAASSLLADTNGLVLKEGSRKDTVVDGVTTKASTWGQSLVPKENGTFMYNGGISKGASVSISEVVGSGKSTYRVYVEKGGKGNPEGFTEGTDTLISSGVSEEISKELIRQQKAYIIGGNVLAARGSSGKEYISEKEPSKDPS